MRRSLNLRLVSTLAAGGLMLQAGGCTFMDINEALQTVFLAVTAAGSIAILRNI